VAEEEQYGRRSVGREGMATEEEERRRQRMRRWESRRSRGTGEHRKNRRKGVNDKLDPHVI